jgi:hypothetical protein
MVHFWTAATYKAFTNPANENIPSKRRCVPKQLYNEKLVCRYFFIISFHTQDNSEQAACQLTFYKKFKKVRFNHFCYEVTKIKREGGKERGQREAQKRKGQKMKARKQFRKRRNYATFKLIIT